MGKLLETTALVSKRINAGLRVTGIIMCMVESSTRLAQEVQRLFDLPNLLRQRLQSHSRRLFHVLARGTLRKERGQ